MHLDNSRTTIAKSGLEYLIKNNNIPTPDLYLACKSGSILSKFSLGCTVLKRGVPSATVTQVHILSTKFHLQVLNKMWLHDEQRFVVKIRDDFAAQIIS
jgi:hypothetical protein